MSHPYQSGDFAVAEEISTPQFSQPFPGVNTSYVLTSEWMQRISDFSPLALDTPHTDYPDYILVEESEVQDQGHGIGKWTRTYAKVPDTYEEPGGTYNYNFVGFYGIFGFVTEAVTGRSRFRRTVPVKIERAFYNTDDPETDIPIIQAQRYYYASNPNLDLSYLADSPPFVEATTPSRSDYEDMISNEDYIAVEDSRVSRWLGNIFMRETMYIKAL
jgi:hypothetical protein